MTDNYEKQVAYAQSLFLTYNQDEMIRKFQLRADETYLYLPLLNQCYRILRSNGSIEQICGKTTKKVTDYNLSMTLYDVLCYSGSKPHLSGQHVSLASLQVTMSSPSDQIFLQKYADFFSGNISALWAACETIAGRKLSISAGADVYWEFDFFPFFPIEFRFWDQDEEFPAQIKLLWDKNSLDFMHFETLYYAMHVLMEVLKEHITQGT